MGIKWEKKNLWSPSSKKATRESKGHGWKKKLSGVLSFAEVMMLHPL